MAMAMIVLKNTPRGFKLIPVSEVNEGRGLQLSNSDPMALRCREVMDVLIHEAKTRSIYRTTIKELFDLIERRFGEGSFPDCKILPSRGETPARLLIKG